MTKKKSKIVSPRYSFKGWRFLKLVENHRDLLIASFSVLVWVALFLKLLTDPQEYTAMEIVAQPSAAAGVVWTLLHGWAYFKGEQRE